MIFMKNVHKTARILKEKMKSLFRLLGFITTWEMDNGKCFFVSTLITEQIVSALAVVSFAS